MTRPNGIAMLLLSAIALTSQPILSQEPSTAPPRPELSISIAPYDVASIHINRNGGGNQHISTDNGSLLAENATLKTLVWFAYGVAKNLLVGGPAWFDTTRFDIKAKTVGVEPIDRKQMSTEQRTAVTDQMKVSIRALLEDRFQLKLHSEDRPVPCYAIVAAKSGPRMTLSDENSNARPAPAGTGGFAGAPGIRMMGRGHIVATETTLDQLALYLTNRPFGDGDRPVLNRSGLTGKYDFSLTWTPDSDPQRSDSPPDLFTALQEQLGLKLEPQKQPVKFTVIDRAELPTVN